EGEILVEGTPQDIASDRKAREKFFGEGFKLDGSTESISPGKRDYHQPSLPEKKEKEKNIQPEE
ncbi:unnamed protein product, partial [marine sediment metagenome]